MRCSPRTALATLALATATLAAGCSTGGSDAATTTTAGAETTVDPTTAPTSTTPATSPPSSTPGDPAASTTVPAGGSAGTDPAAAGDPLDWDQARWDFGNLVTARRDATSVVISFDRYQVLGADGTAGEGPSLTEEPLILANTDVPYLSTSSQLRDYRVAPNALIQVLTNAGDVCRGSFGEGPEVGPAWEEITPAELVTLSSKGTDLAPAGFGEVAQDDLSFDGDGIVTQIRFLRGC